MTQVLFELGLPSFILCCSVVLFLLVLGLCIKIVLYLMFVTYLFKCCYIVMVDLCVSMFFLSFYFMFFLLHIIYMYLYGPCCLI